MRPGCDQSSRLRFSSTKVNVLTKFSFPLHLPAVLVNYDGKFPTIKTPGSLQPQTLTNLLYETHHPWQICTLYDKHGTAAPYLHKFSLHLLSLSSFLTRYLLFAGFDMIFNPPHLRIFHLECQPRNEQTWLLCATIAQCQGGAPEDGNSSLSRAIFT